MENNCVKFVGDDVHVWCHSWNPVAVDIHDEAASLEEIVKHIPCKRPNTCVEGHTKKIWLCLNVHQREPFKGYDFAYIEVCHQVDNKTYKVVALQLFQVTVSVESKSRAAEKKKMVKCAVFIHAQCCICCSYFFISGNFCFFFVSNSLAYITIHKNNGKIKIT